jgi:hypothetical protein
LQVEQEPEEQLEHEDELVFSLKSKLVRFPEVANEDIFLTTFFSAQCTHWTSARLSFREQSFSKFFPQLRH